MRGITILVTLLVTLIYYVNATKLVVGMAITVSELGLSWTYTHMIARKALLAEYSNLEMPYQIIPVTSTNTCDNVCKQALIQYINSTRMDAIICAGTPFSAVVRDVAALFPNVKFHQSTSNVALMDNLSFFFGNITQTRYLSGILAGLKTENNIVAHLIEVNATYTFQQANAFALGVWRVNPLATVYVMNIGKFNNPQYDRIAAEELWIKTGYDTFSAHTMFGDSYSMACSLRGVRYIYGYGSDMSKFVGDTVMTSNQWNWAVPYRHFINQLFSNTWYSQSYVGNLTDGTVQLSPYSKDVSQCERKMMDKFENAVISGQDPMFCGSAVSQFNPSNVTGCISLAKFSSITSLLPGIVYLGNADLTRSQINPVKSKCWNPPKRV